MSLWLGSSLGKPRRLSKKFLEEERDKLEKYREKARVHYHELRSGLRDGLPPDLARPLTVGQRVIARHPRTRQIHDGSILTVVTVDRSRCRVQFDRPELGVELVMVRFKINVFQVSQSALSECFRLVRHPLWEMFVECSKCGP